MPSAHSSCTQEALALAALTRCKAFMHYCQSSKAKPVSRRICSEEMSTVARSEAMATLERIVFLAITSLAKMALYDGTSK